MALITIKNAAFSYENNLVLTGVNFEVMPGDYLCILGENGSGKSTLIKGMLGLKSPRSGSITFGEGLLSTEIGYLPQQTAAQKDFPASVYEVVLSGRLSRSGFRPFFSKADKQVVKDNLAQLGISELHKRCYRELSGGQQQRVLLARALCATQKLLLLDEPVSGLDPLVTQEFYATVEELNKKSGVTVIMVSHDMQSAVRFASHVLHLEHEQAFFGKKDLYMKTDYAKRFMGGMPNVCSTFTNALL